MLCDLGIAKLKEAGEVTLTATHAGPGTVPYMAPEVFLKKKRGLAVDVYSFGCLLIELFGRQRVWGSYDQAQIMMQVLGSFNTPSVGPATGHLCGVREEVCTLCTQIDPISRPTIQRVLQILESL